MKPCCREGNRIEHRTGKRETDEERGRERNKRERESVCVCERERESKKAII